MNPHLLFVVQGCTLHYRTAQLDRFQVGDRCDSTGPADLIVDADEPCQCLFRLELIGHCPPRELCSISELFLVWELVYLYHDAVSRERQILSFGIPICDEILDFIDGSAYLSLVRDRKSPAFCCLKGFIVGLVGKCFTQHMIKGTFQSAIGNHGTVNQLEGTGSRITRICERLLLILLPFLVQAVEGRPWHVYFASYLELFRPWGRLLLRRREARRRSQLLRDVADVPYIGCNIVTYRPVASGQRPEKSAVSVCQTYGCTVEFEFTAECE